MLPGNLVTFRVLEPYAVKVASTVLRRERRGDPPDLSDSTPPRQITHIVTVTQFRQMAQMLTEKELTGQTVFKILCIFDYHAESLYNSRMQWCR
jgi:hypothetical protein